jgi:predicted esterase
MLAPRAGGAFAGPPPVIAIVDELSKRYPIDPKRVFLVGHSMGASHALAIAQQSPERLAGVAMLGGAGAARKPESLAKLPVFIGCGQSDFALSAARALGDKLEKAGVERLRVREYPDVEHLTIVREAISDMFLFWRQ